MMFIVGCRKNATFIKDVMKLNDKEDIQADELGVWKNKRVWTNHFSVAVHSNKKIKWLIRHGTKKPVKVASIYVLIDDDRF